MPIWAKQKSTRGELMKESKFPIDLIKQIIMARPLCYSGIRKIMQDVTYETKQLPSLTYQDLGYTSAKHKQLLRNYFNPEEFQRAREILEKRKKQHFTSVALSLRNETKKKQSMGWCMLSLVVSKFKNNPNLETVEIQYRSTEVIRKFGGDLAFLPWVFDQLNLNPEIIRFRFANLYFSGVFFPTLCLFWEPIDFLEYLYKYDRKMFDGSTRFFLRSARTKDQKFPYSPENGQHQLAWKHLNMREIHDYLHEKHKDSGKELPAIYKSTETYTPRSKRKKSK